MRLWHEALLTKLPRQQLLGQHREVAALRGAGWGKKHATVDYVFDHSPYKLDQYHLLVMAEMHHRGYRPAAAWLEPTYRGQKTPPYQVLVPIEQSVPIYPEHTAMYLEECLANLRSKGIYL